jgi:hypothetical protein
LLRLKYKDLDMSFRLDQAELEAKAIPKADQAPAPTKEETDKFTQLAKISPNSAIAEKSREIEETLFAYGQAQGISDQRYRGWLAWTRELRNKQLIDSATAALLDDLRAVRNNAVHGGRNELSEEDAHRFGALADQLIASLQISTAAALQPRGGAHAAEPHSIRLSHTARRESCAHNLTAFQIATTYLGLY